MSPTSALRQSNLRSPEKVRSLDAASLGLEAKTQTLVALQGGRLPCVIDDDDARLRRVRELLGDGHAGVILMGPPGTSKTWYAAQIAARLADRDPKRVRFVQFHPSYQYEDFVQGYVPDANVGGFRLADKHLLEMCDEARRQEGKLCVIVIDELSRTDPARVFGEALTYMEVTKRNMSFHLASGQEVSIPANLAFLATMNPLDRGVDEVDAALERRFAKIPMDPDVDILKSFLIENQMEPGLQDRVIRFFAWLQTNAAATNPYARLGHTYFLNTATEEDLRRLWDHQLRFFFEKAYRIDPEGLRSVGRSWAQVIGQTSDESAIIDEEEPENDLTEGAHEAEAAPEGSGGGS